MFKYLIAAVPAFFLSFVDVEARTSNFKIDAVSDARNATIHIPDDIFEAGVSAPVVFAFHGPGSSETAFERRSQIIEEADRRGYIAVIPNGSKRKGYKGSFWNVAPFLEPNDEYSLETDEEFVRLLIEFLDKDGFVDHSRIFATGFSMGGMMAYKLGCTMPETFSAIAVVAGALTTTDCNPSDPVSLFHLHGMSDERIPYYGGATGLGDSAWPEAMTAIRAWEARTQCGPAETVPVSTEGMCRRSTCQDGNIVEHCVSYDLGHAWAGRKLSKAELVAYGEQKETAFKATEMIFDFFDDVPGRYIPEEDVVEEDGAATPAADEIEVQALDTAD
jgi:polyhydroxybutyrate depolymerase